MDLRRLGPAILVDADGIVLESNEAGRVWLVEGGAAPLASSDTPLKSLASMQPNRWVERVNPDGSTSQALLSVVPQAEGGALLLIAEAPERRKASDSHLRTTLDSLPAMIGYWDRDLRNRYANKAYVEWFGMSPEQMYGLHIKELLGPEIFAKNLRHIEAALRGEEQHFERTIPRPDGSGARHANAVYIPEFRGHDVIGFSVLVSDVTELKSARDALDVARLELERRVEERTVELERSNRELARSNAELAHFARVASHDLKEPLRTVANYCELLGERYSGQLDERADRYLRYVVEGATRLHSLVGALLAIAQIGAEQRPFLQMAPEDAAHAALAGLRLRVEESGAEVIIEPMPTVCGDLHEVTEVFQNLFANALKFTDVKPPRVIVAARDLGDFVEISVTDNGIGLDPQYATKVFEMFHRVHARSVYEGSGIGLALTKKIIEKHGGMVGVRSSIGHGASFWFTLPKHSPDQ